MRWLRWCLISLLLAQVARAGTPFSEMGNVGPITSWPHPTTIAFHEAIDRLVTNRLSESTIMRQRVRYVRQAFDGSATGGGTNGLSPQTAWKCRTMADVRALVITQLAPDTTILFRCGDTFYAAPANTEQGIPQFTFGRYTFASYVDPSAPSSAKPRLLGFVPVNPLDLQYFSPYTYDLQTPFDVYWVRGRRIGSDYARGFREVPYIKQADISQVPGFDRTWSISAGRTLRMCIGLESDYDDPGTLEIQVTTGAGISIGEVDDVRLDGLIIEGWGMNIPSEGYGAIRSSANGTNALVVTNCEWGWTAYHGLLHATGGSGGILLIKDCSFGYHVNREAALGGGGDGLVSYATAGNNELVIDGCRSFGGSLSRSGVPGSQGNSLGMPVYQHALHGLNIALHLRRNCNFTPTHPTRGHYSDYAAAADAVCDLSGRAIDMPTDPLDVRYYRAFVIGETARFEISQFGGTWRAVDINCRLTCRIPAIASGILFHWGVTQNAYGGMAINRDLELSFDPGFRGYYALGQANMNHNHVLINGRIRLTGASPIVPADFFLSEVDPARLATCRVFNTIISNETQAAALRWNYPNADALQNSGGMAHCAFFRVPVTTYDQSSTPLTLADAANFLPGDPEAISPQLVGVSGPLPAGLRLEYDALMHVRPPASTIGPLEGVPVPCAADVNHDGVVDFFDYLDFLAAWTSGLPAADFNHDLTIDLFDYLDFLASLSTGC